MSAKMAFEGKKYCVNGIEMNVLVAPAGTIFSKVFVKSA
jgi:hypothetical protein